MKKVLISLVFVLGVSGFAFAQTGNDASELNSKGEPVVKSKDNAPVELKTGETIKRGDALASGVKKTTIEKVMKDPNKFADKTVAISGVIVRSCKKEGCWMEMADKEGGKSVRVTFGDHKFFIPLNSAGLAVKTQGVFKTKILPKDHVDHLIKDDGAKFDKINADGTVTEVSFEAIGVELTKK
ncbi:MAG TPA: DUF4920 domain-containing protein [Pyrinomonadaceae bacterium]|nr:DUF4920 domain-containing protein [Pyrinomonadaceae bacterium]